jgi:Secretion system C-terminal sorting domain
MKILMALLISASFLFSQTVYEIPFASEGNVIELEVLNSSEINVDNIIVNVVDKPDWIKFDENEKILTEIHPSENGKVKFQFNVDNEANVLEESTLKFKIAGNNQAWGKEIKISVLPPDKFELNQNYPNPFNPTSTISYTVPAAAETGYIPSLQLVIYDILGREVETLVNEEQSPGYYKIAWNANNYASGIYIYEVSIKNKNSKSEVIRKKMMLMK